MYTIIRTQLFTPCVILFPYSAILDDDEDRDSGMQSHSTDEEVPPLIVPPIMPGIVPPIIPGIVPPIIPGIVPPIIPGIVTPIITVIDVKTDSIFNVQIQDSEYCNNRYVLNITCIFRMT